MTVNIRLPTIGRVHVYMVNRWHPYPKTVPQGSVLGLFLFILYTADIPSLFTNHPATGHLFADDVQAFVHRPPSAQLLVTSQIDAHSQDPHICMSSNRFSLNALKTQLIWCVSVTPRHLQKLLLIRLL